MTVARPLPPAPAAPPARRHARVRAWALAAVFVAALALPAAWADLPARVPAPPEDVGTSLHRVSEVLGGALMVVTSFLSLLALLALVAAAAPAATARIAVELRSSQLKCFLLGTVDTLFLLFLAAASHGVLAVLVVPILGVMFLLGLTAACDDIGRRVLALTRLDTSRMGRLVLGGTVYYFASLFPVVGWFLIFPYFALAGSGASLVWLFSRRSAGAATAPQPPPAPARPAPNPFPPLANLVPPPGSEDAGVPPRPGNPGELPPPPPAE